MKRSGRGKSPILDFLDALPASPAGPSTRPPLHPHTPPHQSSGSIVVRFGMRQKRFKGVWKFFLVIVIDSPTSRPRRDMLLGMKRRHGEHRLSHGFDH